MIFKGIMIYFCLYFLTLIGLFACSLISGAIRYALRKDSKVIKNGFIIFLANFILDKNKGLFYRIISLLLRHSWEMPQTLLGNVFSQFKNIIWQTDRVDLFGGVCFSIKYNHNHNSGISLGNFININTYNQGKDDFEKEIISEPLFMHEYGHTIDSRLFGPLYLFVIGIPSLVSAIRAHQVENQPQGVSSHYFSWCERRANRNAREYFSKHFSVDWASSYKGYTIETFYRLVKNT
jgi:hypothetical protein